MPHPEHEHALMIDVARLRKERDEALSREARLAAANKALAADVTRCAGIESALAAERRECDEQREAKEAAYDRIYKALAALDADDLWSTRVINARAALDAPAAGEEGKNG